jgi:hypothetical protein
MSKEGGLEDAIWKNRKKGEKDKQEEKFGKRAKLTMVSRVGKMEKDEQ